MHKGKLSRDDAHLYQQLYYTALGADLGSQDTREAVCSTLLGLQGCRSEDLASEIFVLKIINRMTYEKLAGIITNTLKLIKENNSWKTVIFYDGVIGYKSDILFNKIWNFQRNVVRVPAHSDNYMAKILSDASI